MLADRGLDAALSGLAARSPVPVTVEVDPGRGATGRPSQVVEAIAYFVVAEALTNVAKHSRATRAAVVVRRLDGLLRIVVTDDGVGGADPSAGHRPARPGRPGVRSGRPVVRRQPARRPDRAHRGAAVRVVIAEDSVLLREGLARLLGRGRLRGGRRPSATASSCCARSASTTPDVVVADVRMPPTHTDEGLRAALVIRQRWPETAVLVLSQYVEERYATELLAGDTRGVGYLLKDRVADVDEFLEALRRVGRGGTALDPEVVSQLLPAAAAGPLDALTPREQEVLKLMAEGRSNGAIAAALVVTEGAVEKHVSSIFTKLGLTPTDTDHRRVLAVLSYLDGR